MTETLRYIFKTATAILLSVHFLNAQSVILPSALRIGTDVSKLGVSLLDPGHNQYELNADVDVYKFFIACDYGRWKTRITGEDYDYHMDGRFFRAGIDYNFLYSDIDNHVICFGLRYGMANFDENFDYHVNDLYFGSYNESVSKTRGKANWIELLAGIKAHIWKGLFMGWSGRMQFGLNTNSPGSFTTYEIPGFGKSTSQTSWELNYNIYYRFEFRKKPRIMPKTKKEK